MAEKLEYDIITRELLIVVVNNPLQIVVSYIRLLCIPCAVICPKVIPVMDDNIRHHVAGGFASYDFSSRETAMNN